MQHSLYLIITNWAKYFQLPGKGNQNTIKWLFKDTFPLKLLCIISRSCCFVSDVAFLSKVRIAAELNISDVPLSDFHRFSNCCSTSQCKICAPNSRVYYNYILLKKSRVRMWMLCGCLNVTYLWLHLFELEGDWVHQFTKIILTLPKCKENGFFERMSLCVCRCRCIITKSFRNVQVSKCFWDVCSS